MQTAVFPERYPNDVSDPQFATSSVSTYGIFFVLHMLGVVAAISILVLLPFLWAVFITGQGGDMTSPDGRRTVPAAAAFAQRAEGVRPAQRGSATQPATRGSASRGIRRLSTIAFKGIELLTKSSSFSGGKQRLGLSSAMVRVRAAHATLLVGYVVAFFLLMQHADTSDYCAQLGDEYARRGLSGSRQLIDACNSWPRHQIDTCTSFSSEIAPVYTCQYVNFTLTALESQLVDFGLDQGPQRGACRKNECKLFQHARAIALEFGVLFLAFCYFVSYGLPDLERLMGAEASVTSAIANKVASVADVTKRGSGGVISRMGNTLKGEASSVLHLRKREASKRSNAAALEVSSVTAQVGDLRSAGRASQPQALDSPPAVDFVEDPICSISEAGEDQDTPGCQ